MTTKWPQLPLSEAVTQIRMNAQIQNDQFYELWSVPAFQYGVPETVLGESIGSGKFVVQQGDVLLSKINPRINRVWLVEKPARHLDQIASTEWIVLRPREAEIDSRYLVYALSSPHFREVFTSNVTGTTGSHTRGKASVALEYEIPFPPLDEQKRIVAKLDAAMEEFDRLNANLEQQLSQLTDFDSALLSEMLTDPRHTPEPAVTTKWPVLPLSEVTELITRGIAPKYATQAGVVVINQRCIRDQSVNLDSARLHDADVKPVADSKYVQHGDGLVNSTGVGTLGRTAVFDSKTVDTRVTVDSHVTIVRPKQGLFVTGFLRYALELCEGAFVEHSTGSGGQTELSRSAVGNELIPLPPLVEQKRIVATLDEAALSSSSLRSNILDRKKSASELQSSILAAAFAGVL